MNKNRLLEIATVVDKLDGPNIVLGYLATLSQDDSNLFFSCIKESKFKDLDFYTSIKEYCRDYVSNNPKLERVLDLERLDFRESVTDLSFDYGFNSNYLFEDENYKTVKK